MSNEEYPYGTIGWLINNLKAYDMDAALTLCVGPGLADELRVLSIYADDSGCLVFVDLAFGQQP